MPVDPNRLTSWSQTPRPVPLPWFTSGILIGCLAPILGRILLALSNPLFTENGPIEDAQALLLIVATFGYVKAYVDAVDTKALFCAAMSVVAILALQREIPACESAFFEGGLCLDRAVKFPLSTAVMIIGGILALAKRPQWRNLLDYRILTWVWPVGIATLLLITAELAEHALHQEIEETLEFGAYAYFACFAWWAARAKSAP